MMVLDHVGDEEAMVYAQLGQQPLVRTTETSPEPRPGTLSCLSAQPPDLATATAAQPEVACVRPSIVPFLYSKRTAAARSPGSRYGRSTLLSPLRLYQPWNNPQTSRVTRVPPPRLPGYFRPHVAPKEGLLIVTTNLP
jgi:hypothetical protein